MRLDSTRQIFPWGSIRCRAETTAGQRAKKLHAALPSSTCHAERVPNAKGWQHAPSCIQTQHQNFINSIFGKTSFCALECFRIKTPLFIFSLCYFLFDSLSILYILFYFILFILECFHSRSLHLTAPRSLKTKMRLPRRLEASGIRWLGLWTSKSSNFESWINSYNYYSLYIYIYYFFMFCVFDFLQIVQLFGVTAPSVENPSLHRA